jgi:hypothetical protein
MAEEGWVVGECWVWAIGFGFYFLRFSRGLERD